MHLSPLIKKKRESVSRIPDVVVPSGTEVDSDNWTKYVQVRGIVVSSNRNICNDVQQLASECLKSKPKRERSYP